MAITNINIPSTPPSGSSQATISAYVALGQAQTAFNNAIATVANAIQADTNAALQQKLQDGGAQ
jgi:hypothetical protein